MATEHSAEVALLIRQQFGREGLHRPLRPCYHLDTIKPIRNEEQKYVHFHFPTC